MATQVNAQSFIPNPPDFTSKFFEPEPKLPTQTSSPTLEKSTLSTELLEKTLSEGTPLPADFDLHEPKLAPYYHFINQNVLGNDYHSSPYGLVCPHHPEAKHPHPGPKPTPPSGDHSLIQQLIQRGLSSSYRLELRAYKEALNHWEVLMKNHLLEVPYLVAKDDLYLSFFSLLQQDYQSALEKAQDSLELYPFNPEAVAIQIIAHFRLGQFEQAYSLLDQLYLLLNSPVPLNDLGFEWMESIIQSELKNTYMGTCQKALHKLEGASSSISLEPDYFQKILQSILKDISIDYSFKAKEFSLDDLAQFFVEEILHSDSNKSSVESGLYVPFLNLIFEGIQECFYLIGALDKWSEFKISALLQPGSDSPQKKSKALLKQVIEELTTPVSCGDAIFRRAFMQNGMKIQLGIWLIEELWQEKQKQLLDISN